MQDVLIITAGGLARETAAVLERSTHQRLIGFLDDEPGLQGAVIAGKPVLGTLDQVSEHPTAALLIGAGKGRTRRLIASRLDELGVGDDRYATVVAPDVAIPAGSHVGSGSVLLAGTVLTADVTVGQHVVTMPGVVLTHDDRVGDFATLCARVALGGAVTIGEGAYLGMGALVRERVNVGSEAVLGMGAVLLRDLPDGETWAGVPARRLRTPPGNVAAEGQDGGR